MSKRIRVAQVAVPLQHDTGQVIKKACRTAGIPTGDLEGTEIIRKSVDARRRDALRYTYTVDLLVADHIKYRKNDRNVREVTIEKYHPAQTGQAIPDHPVAVIGTGPAGLFCAYLLAKYGYKPLIFERGKPVEERQADVEAFWAGGALDPESNVQFGEGGAGTFSDGKLNTMVKDKSGRNRFVLETFAVFGAPADILYESRPHIGTDILRAVVSNMRKEILHMGGRYFFSSAVTDFEVRDHQLTALIVNGSTRVPVSAAVLAVGHSARDTFAVLKKRQADLCPKPFAVGMRVEHPQEMIDVSQYGEGADRSLLPPAAYKLTWHASNGRSVYTFCMCPGGYVVNASSQEGGTAVNGMSYRARDAKNANSAVIVSVTPEDFPDPDDPLSGVAFQRTLEERAWRAGGGCIPQQCFGDFEQGISKENVERQFASCTKGAAREADLTGIFPASVRDAFVEGMHAFGKKIAGFDRPDAVLSAVESRTSSPVRIVRDETFQSNIRGLYPCGEGAGYAGGITSAAMDGLKCAEAVMACYKAKEEEIHE